MQRPRFTQQAREHSTGSHEDTPRLHSTPAALSTQSLSLTTRKCHVSPTKGAPQVNRLDTSKETREKREDGGTCPNWEEPNTMWVNVTQRRTPEETLMT